MDKTRDMLKDVQYYKINQALNKLRELGYLGVAESCTTDNILGFVDIRTSKNLDAVKILTSTSKIKNNVVALKDFRK